MEDDDYILFMQKVHEEFGSGRGSIRKFLEWVSRNKFAVLDPNLKSILQCLTIDGKD